MKMKFALAALYLTLFGFLQSAQGQINLSPIQINKPLQPNQIINPPSPEVLDKVAASILVKNYADTLEKRFKGKSVGYQFVVFHSTTGASQERAGGDARRAPDSNPRKMTVNDKYNIASVSKTITASAVLKLLNEKKISIDSPVYSYLPPDWKLGTNIKTITFRELLTHRAGLRCDKEVFYNELQNCVAKGITLQDKKTWKYNNSNYGLFRVIIPRLLVNKLTVPNGETPSSYYARTYMSYVQRSIFFPAGLGTNIFCKPTDASPALTYQFPKPIIGGDNYGDMTETNASRGWNMSSKQLSAFMNNLLFTEKILPPKVREQMKSEGLGLYTGNLNSKIVSYEHGGYYPGKNDKGELYNKGELNSLVLGFSNGVSVSVIINSQLGPGLSPSQEAQTAMKEVLK